MKLSEAIDVLKERSAWIKLHFKESTHAEAIDTVVAEYEKSMIDEETNRCKRCGCFGCICDSIDGI